MAVFLVTGGAGFIGSNLVAALVDRGEQVRVIDDFSTGRRENLASFMDEIELFEGSICDTELLAHAMAGVDYCLHQAAIPSVPRSVEDPVQTNQVNVEGTIKVFLSARDAQVRRVVFASSSAVYGNAKEMPVKESFPRQPISPYGVNKAADEMYASAFSALYDMDIVALRYFNVFGPRQDPTSQYAAVIPHFIACMLKGGHPPVDGDGLQSRDFSYVDNVVEGNLKVCDAPIRLAGIYNIACGSTTSVLDLVGHLNRVLGTSITPVHRAARPGDIRHSYADITRAKEAFGYKPLVGVEDGLRKTVEWFRNGVPA